VNLNLSCSIFSFVVSRLITVSLKGWKSTNIWEQQQELSSKQNKACSVIRMIKSPVSLKSSKSAVFLLCSFHYILWFNVTANVSLSFKKE